MSQKRKSAHPVTAKCKAKKSNSHKKDASIMRELAERPLTRRNRNEVREVKEFSSVSKLGKEGMTIPPTSEWTSGVVIEEQMYLQFSLRITEEIISNDLYTNDEMIYVIKHHYMANKCRLDQAKLLKSIEELCLQLNIPFDEPLRTYLKEDISGEVANLPNSISPQHPNSKASDTNVENIGNMDVPNTYSPNIEPGSRDQGLPPTDTENFLKELPTLTDEIATNSKDTALVAEGIRPMKESYSIDVIRSATFMEDFSKSFEIGESILTSSHAMVKPLLSGIMNLRQDWSKTEFRVLHDGISRFVMESDAESEMVTTIQPNVSSVTCVKEVHITKEPVKKAKDLVAVHYVTSLEPTNIKTLEFSTQVSMPSIKEHKIPLQLSSTDKISAVFPANTEGKANPPSTKKSPIAIETSNSDVPYLLFDYPLVLSRERTKSMKFLRSHGNFSEQATVNFVTTPNQFPMNNANNTFKNTSFGPSLFKFNMDDYDLTPQKDAQQIDSPVLNASQIQPQASNMHVARTSTRTDRINRYRKVSENLSFFYPTTATQVSSTDLLTRDFISQPWKCQNKKVPSLSQTREQVEWKKQSFQSQQPSVHNQHQQYTPPSDYWELERIERQERDRHERERQERDRQERDRQERERQERERLERDRQERERQDWNRQERQRLERERIERQERRKFEKPVKVDTSCGNSPPNSNSHTISYIDQKGEKQSQSQSRSKYPLNELDGNQQSFSQQTSQKRSYVQDVSTDRDEHNKKTSKSHRHRKYPASHSSRTNVNCKSIEEEVSGDRTLGHYSSDDSMEKRILSLRQDIEKYSKDDESSKRIGEPFKRNEILGMLRHKILPDISLEGSLEKEVSILRK